MGRQKLDTQNGQPTRHAEKTHVLALNPLWQSSFSAIRYHERSRQYYERKRKDGKRHNAAVVALARRRLTVLFTMMANHSLYQEPEEQKIA